MTHRTTSAARCPDCGAIGMDYCERVKCSWDQWNDGTRVTAKQRADGAAFAEAMNAWLAARRDKEAEAWRESCRILSAEMKDRANGQ